MKQTPLLVAMMLTLLAGCSVLGPLPNTDDHRYMINAMPVSFNHLPKTQAILLVTEPETAAVYNTTNMAYTDKPYQVSYYSQSQWAETPAQMFLPLLSQSLEKTGSFKAVVVAPYIGNYDYVINTQIIKCQQNYLDKNHAYVELVIQAQITKTSSGRSIATKQFVVNTPIGDPSPYNGVIATNAAMARALIQIGHFAVNAIHS